MQDLNITLVQYDIAWCDSKANIDRISGHLEKSYQRQDLVVLPETFTSGFYMKPAEVAQDMRGEGVNWLRQKATSNSAHFMGSLIIRDDDRYYNRLICAHPDDTLSFYDKRHLFTYAGEHQQFTAGGHRLELDIKGWKICPLICYDLRFPVWSRNTSDYDVLIYVANWPAARTDAWTSLLKARAIENQCYVIGVNRTGTDGNNIDYAGASVVFDMGGRTLLSLGNEATTGSVSLSHAELQEFRERYNFLADRDSYTID